SKGFFATLFGREEPDDSPAAAPASARRAPAPTQVAAYAPQASRSPALVRAEANRPRGETFIGPAGGAPLPPRRPDETVVASFEPPTPVLGPLPPARPAEFAMASIRLPATAPLPPAREASAKVASLFGGAPAGQIAGTPGLPPV